ncbi:hypothetical protein NBRC116494_22320 [Aurantivibrio plasticivorans]
MFLEKLPYPIDSEGGGIMLGFKRKHTQQRPVSASPYEDMPNIWALDKHMGIKSLLLVLVDHLGEASFKININETVNRQAIYIEHPECEGLRAYLYNYGQEQNCYGAHLEFPDVGGETSIYNTFEGLSVAQLSSMLASHFDIC